MECIEKLEELGFCFNEDNTKEDTLNKMSYLEKKYQIELPYSYKETISLVAGQYPEYDFFLPVKETHPYFGEDNIASFIDFINPIEDAFDNLENEWIEYLDRMPDEIVPIINANGGNYICLGIKGNFNGKVYYWIRGLEVNENFQRNGWKAVFLIADSFEEFLNNITVIYY